MRHQKLWLGLGAVVLVSFLVLGGQGVRISRSLPPIPDKVVTPEGTLLLTGESILRGQNVWQSIGGQQVGSVWGHGAYVAPDWSADWLHREALFVLDTWARAEGSASYSEAPAERQAALRERLAPLMRTNTHDASTGTLTLAPVRAEALRANSAHYADVFSQGRSAYAIPQGALTHPEKLKDLGAFFWWTSWVASTNRPGDTVSYTQNWPHEPLVGNRPAPGVLLWSLASGVLLLAGVGALVWYWSGRPREEQPAPPARDPFSGMRLTPSQRASTACPWRSTCPTR
jgi:nitric oxide reductase subunit B